METPITDVFHLDKCLLIALRKFNYSVDEVFRLSNEVDRLLFFEDSKTVKKQAVQLFKNSEVFRMGLKFKDKELANDYVAVALTNLKYNDEQIKDILLEVDRLMFEVEVSKIEKKALKINKRIFPCLFS